MKEEEKKLADKAIALVLREKAATYRAQILCLNCGYSGILEIPKGVRVKGKRCPNCECKMGCDDE